MCLYGAYDDIMGLADVYGVTHKLFPQCTQAQFNERGVKASINNNHNQKLLKVILLAMT